MVEQSESANASDAPKEGAMHVAKRVFSPFTRRFFVALVVAVIALLLWQIANVVLLLFLGVLLVIFLNMLAGVQQVESYLVTPLVQEQGTSLPPAFTYTDR